MAKIILAIIANFVLMIMGAFYYFYEFEYKAYLHAPMQKKGADIVYNFAAGARVDAMINDLHKKGAIIKPNYVKAYARLAVDSTRLKAGVYQIKPSVQSPAELFKMLISGKTKRVKIRLPAGWTLAKVLKSLGSSRALSNSGTVLDEAVVKSKLDIKRSNLEGLLYPDTYLIEPGMSDLQLVKIAYDHMANVLQAEWENRSSTAQVKNPYEALILASIIEKETARPEEKRIISGVFNNRLKKKMRLQTDPTIIYGMGDKYKGNITKKDLHTDGPYNTYTRAGLPPTPICLPSASSINAALNPAKTQALFFVAKGDGTHSFSSTYKEHKKAVWKYQIEASKK